jgi:hypothetical protein
MSAKLDESTSIHLKVVSTVRQNALLTPTINFTGMGTQIINMTAKASGWQTIYPTQRVTTAMSIPNPQGSGMLVLHQMSQDQFVQHEGQIPG